MGVKTLSIRLEGDRDVARRLQLDNLARVLHQLNDNNKQDLPIVSSRTKFLLPSGALVGEIYVQNVHGAQTAVITGITSVAPKPKEELQIEIPTEVIVPIIRSTDNQYWVVCLSGTFEKPYLLVKNPGLTAEQLDDNAEYILDGRMLTTTSSGELVFIAQTGIRPDDIDFYTNPETSSTTESLSPEPYACQGDYLGCDLYGAMYQYYGHIFETKTSSYSTENTDDFIILGEVNPMLPSATTASQYGTSVSRRIYGGFEFKSFTWSEFACDELYADFLQWYVNYPPSQLAVEAALESYATPQESLYSSYTTNGTGTNSTINVTLFSDENSIRIEEGNTSNVCAGYRVSSDVSTQTTTQEGPDRCTQEIGDPVSDLVVTQTFADYFQINDMVFELTSSTSSYYPELILGSGDQKDSMKYYNTGASVPLTGMMSVGVKTDAYNHYSEFRYYYVGPNSDNTLSTTVFPAVDEQFKHTIPGMSIDGEDIEFEGKIFLGRLRSSTVQKII